MKRSFFSRLLFILVLCGCESTAKVGALRAAEELLHEGDFLKAIRQVNRAVSFYDYDDTARAHLLFIKAESYEKLGQFDKALGLYAYIAAKYPNTEYSFMAKQIVDRNSAVY